MKINWLVRIKNKSFWIMVIPAIIMLAEQVANIFGLSINLLQLQDQAMAIVSTVFMILGITGIVMDPTTKGMSDSSRAMKYTIPKGEDDEQQ